MNSPYWIPVQIRTRRYGVDDLLTPAHIVGFETVQRVKGNGQDTELEGIIFALCIMDNGAILPRKLADLIVSAIWIGWIKEAADYSGPIHISSMP